jgi:large subunit ribosomal protein L29
MKAKDMREKSVEDLVELEKSLVKDAFQARFKNFTNRLDDTASIKKARRDIARVKTLLAERANIGEATPTKAEAPKPVAAKPAAAKAPKAAPKAATKSKAKAAKSSEASK